MPIMISEDIISKINDKDELVIDFKTGEIFDKTQNKKYGSKPFSKSQLEIYMRGGLLI
jgi:3-isopropylmalate dehydratase small subunit